MINDESLQSVLPNVLLQVKKNRRMTWSLLVNAQISYAAGSGQVEIWFEDEAAKELFISSESDILFRGELESELNDGAISFEFHTLTGNADVSKSLKEVNLEEFRYEILTESLAQKDEQIADIKRSSKAAQLGLAFFF